jgi:hypothetical protein
MLVTPTAGLKHPFLYDVKGVTDYHSYRHPSAVSNLCNVFFFDSNVENAGLLQAYELLQAYILI